MRVLLLNVCYRPDVAATGQLLADLGEGLAQRGHEVHAIASRRRYGQQDSEPGYPAEETLAGVRVHRVGGSALGKRSTLTRLADFASFYALAAQRALELPRMDVVAALTSPPYIGTVTWLIPGRKVLWLMDMYPEVMRLHGLSREGAWLDRLLTGLSHRLYARFSDIVSLSPSMTRRLRAQGVPAEKVSTVANWIPGEPTEPPDEADLARRADALRAEWGLPPRSDAIVLMYSGNLGVAHDADTAEQAMRQLADDPGVRWLVVGNGVRLDELKARLPDGLGGRVIFRPHVPLEQVPVSLRVADAHWASLQAEAAGMVMPSKVYGCLATARPVVFIGPESDAADLVRATGGGAVIPNGDAATLVSLVRRWRADPAEMRRMGQAAGDHYRQRLGRARSVGRLISILEGRGDPEPEQVL